MPEQENDCVCPYCLKTPGRVANSCVKTRLKIAKDKYKSRKANYEKKYTLTELLSQREGK